jgi:glyoxylase-like metal-dependent hydrolase (beta-lactamase superfamily II)
MGYPHTIAVYLIPHDRGAVLIESGPGSTIPELTAGLRDYGYSPRDISDVFLTHIHLDHAGAAGWLASQGARVHVHPLGAPHLMDPQNLLSSARRIYGERMEELWGDFLPVPAENLSIVADGSQVEVEGLCFRAYETPGHAFHHHIYLFEQVCFTGDIAGVRLPGPRHLRIPMPPPEFNLDLWRKSLERLERIFNNGQGFDHIAPTHFGIFEDPQWHLSALRRALDEIEDWIESVLPAEPAIDNLRALFLEWATERSLEAGLEPQILEEYETANPSWMSADGIQRYWKKYRLAA